MRERSSLLVDRAAGRCHNERRVVKQKMGIEEYGNLAAHSTDAANSRGHAPKQADEVRIVNM